MLIRGKALAKAREALKALEELPATRNAAMEGGLTKYWTRKPCRKGHTAARFTATGKCAECKREEYRRYYAAGKRKDHARLRKRWAGEQPDRLRVYRLRDKVNYLRARLVAVQLELAVAEQRAVESAKGRSETGPPEDL